MDQTLNELIKLCSKQFNVEATKLSADTDFFETLHINSFQALTLLSSVEKHFKVEIPDYELQGVNTFQALADVIQSHR